MSARDDVVMGGDVVDHRLVLNKCDNYDEIQGVSSVPDNPGSIDSYACQDR